MNTPQQLSRSSSTVPQYQPPQPQYGSLPDSGALPGMIMMGKKGPAVPPKPAKKPSPSTVPPQVPKSSHVKRYCEPSYSTLLGQPGEEHAYTNTGAGRATPGKMGLRKVTLDNAVELQQQKEALEHHKRIMDIKMQRGQADGAVYENTTPKFYEGDVTYANVPGGPRNGDGGLIYSNIAHNNGQKPRTQRQISDELPPPPVQDGQVPLSLNELTLEDNDDEFPPPPSPVSSSYSELRRATDPPPMGRNQPQPTYNMVGPGATGQTYSNLAPNNQIYANNMHQFYGISQGSTYESIYEPINPRPTSQISARSNYSLYTPYVNSRGINSPNDTMLAQQQQQHRHHVPKENEVDKLTDLLVQSMDNVQDPDSFDEFLTDTFGSCSQCGERVVGENTGCTAMDQIFHIACFTCHVCQINLQGKPFYALDGKPYCEEDYLNTLEKCSVCLKPILERILRATGKPYHPQCFTCVICGKSLDGIPFTVDATNQIHCIEDFHKKFAPRCCVCQMPIMPEPGQDETIRVVALDRSFHVACYKCEDCGQLLSSEAEGGVGCYPLDDHILCKSCNAKRVQALSMSYHTGMTTEL